jgi:hypothetical protein
MERTVRSGVQDRVEHEASNSSAESPWRSCAGIWRDNPDWNAFLKQLEEVRHEAEETEARA